MKKSLFMNSPKKSTKKLEIFLIILLIISGLIVTFKFKDKINLTSINLSQFKFTALKNYIESKKIYFQSVESAKLENETLKNKISELEIQKLEYKKLVNEVETLKKFLGIKETYSEFSLEYASVIGNENNNFSHIIVINKGLKNGINNNMPVIVAEGLVGYVLSSTDSTSKILTILDPSSALSAEFTRTKDNVIVKGDINLKTQDLIKIAYASLNSDIFIGENLETSNIGGLYPKGIQVGSVKDIYSSKDKLGKTVIVKPYVDFKHLNEVAVIKAW